MRDLGIEWIRIIGRLWIDGHLRFASQTADSHVPSGHVHLYSRDNKLYLRSDDQVEHEITMS